MKIYTVGEMNIEILVCNERVTVCRVFAAELGHFYLRWHIANKRWLDLDHGDTELSRLMPQPVEILSGPARELLQG